MLTDVRQPRASVQFDGLALPGVLSVDVFSNNHFAADRFNVRLAAQIAPELAFHTPDQRVTVQLLVDGLTRDLLVGSVDSVSLDPIGGTVSIEGRDLSSLLVETQTNDTYPNRTASEIAQLLASRHGLASLVQATTTPVGRYYQSERDSVTLGQLAKATTEWDLLAFLATREGYDLFMQGDALRFAPVTTDAATVLTTADCIGLQMQHCVSLARPIQVNVKSWNSKPGAVNTGTAQSSGMGTVWRREVTRPNLSSADANTLAARSLADLKRHEWLVDLTMPGELALTARSRVTIVGTGTPWDRTYNVTRVSRHLDVQRGFTQRLALQGAV